MTKRVSRTTRRKSKPTDSARRPARHHAKPPDNTLPEDVPFTSRLPDGRTLFVLVPGKWCEIDITGELLFTPEAVRLIDRAMALAMHVPRTPTPAFIRTLRNGLGLTQKQLARRIGVDPLSVSRWERGAVKPSPPAVRALERLRKSAGRRGVVINQT